MTPDTATAILADRFGSPTVGFTEEFVEALHTIIADVIDSCVLAAKCHIDGTSAYRLDEEPLLSPEARDLLGDDIATTVNDYVANHYGADAFGL